jgi:hypothetical protein
MMKSEEIKVFISNRESKCDECGEELGRKAWITFDRDKAGGEIRSDGALCLTCADLDHFTFLPAGDAAVTRRARKHSALSAVVLKWSSARKRYERQGLQWTVGSKQEAALRFRNSDCGLRNGRGKELRAKVEVARA